MEMILFTFLQTFMLTLIIMLAAGYVQYFLHKVNMYKPAVLLYAAAAVFCFSIQDMFWLLLSSIFLICACFSITIARYVRGVNYQLEMNRHS